MPKRVRVDGREFTVPDDATPDEINQIAGPVSAEQPTSQHPILDTVSDLGKGAAKGVLSTVSGADEWARQHLPAFMTNSNFGFGKPADLPRLRAATVPQNTAQTIGKGLEQAGEFLIPGAGEEALAAHLGGGLAARVGAKAVGGALVNKAQGGSAATGAIFGGAGEGVAAGLKAVAPKVAEAALNVAGRDRMYGRTVGEAVLQDTKGVRPSTIQASAKAKIGELAPRVAELADEAGVNGARGSLLPARNAVAATQGTHLLNRAVDSAAELQPIEQRLATDAVTGLPLAQSQTPAGLRALKQGINSDFITRWKPENQGLTKEAQKVYGNLAEEFHNAAPGTAELDQRMSSLFPVAERAGAASNAASITQNVLHKFKTPTGALTGALAGGSAGYEQSHSLSGALTGAALGAIAPAIVANPTTQMIVARSLFSPKLGRFIIPAARGLVAQGTR